MPAIRFTARGAVTLPDTLQVAVGTTFAARLPVGVAQPDRELTLDELEANVRHFTRGGPRSRPVTRLVLSAVGAGHPVLDGIGSLRRLGIDRVVVHTDPASAEACAAAVDHVAVFVRAPQDLEPLERVDRLGVTVPLEEEVLPRLGSLLSSVRALRPQRVVLAWPFPVEGRSPPPPAEEVIRAIEGCGTLLAGLSFTVKGLPPCVLAPLRRGIPDLAERTGRTTNRWYVDVEHQLDRALLFVPDVVRFAKADTCRFCEIDPRCDGVADAWWRLGLAGALLPLREGEVS
ncbi:MAG: hypothetical protein KC621_16770 [Myxococcales bacterium]|nr:hypothetical protein [Myxococcales bacterium]